jgi:hypothetical protein
MDNVFVRIIAAVIVAALIVVLSVAFRLGSSPCLLRSDHLRAVRPPRQRLTVAEHPDDHPDRQEERRPRQHDHRRSHRPRNPFHALTASIRTLSSRSRNLPNGVGDRA